MHNLAVPGHRKIVNIAATSIAAALLAMAQVPLAFSQSTTSSTYAPERQSFDAWNRRTNSNDHRAGRLR